MTKTIIIGADHRGFALKQELIILLKQHNHRIVDQGPYTERDKVDYPDYAQKVAEMVMSDANNFGILICNTGIGMSIAANRVKGIRAAICHDPETAALARQHNDANILVMGAKEIEAAQALAVTQYFLQTKSEGGRHTERVHKIDK